ncbi:Carbonic anhydrase 2 [Orchesella cincta]|uniref:Carbonic anhydrase n=1 Tax=Orchesella cincta TaxID=48709 RepID=A0A1D2NB30_ORCCI|nr:Carbonic anhydrase 2 [Orchesella cincta]
MPSQGKGNRLDASAMMRLTLPYIVFTLICAKNFANAAGDHWCYTQEECDAHTWSGECQTGKQQSPIDFTQKNTIQRNDAVRLRFNRKYSDAQDHFMVKNNGHTIQIQLGNDITSDLVMDGDYFKGSYRFSQLHFHWGSHEDKGSEHTVNGNGYVAELHLVHYSNDYKSLKEAVGTKNRRGLAVLGIFFEISNEDNHALQPIVEAISRVKRQEDDLVRVDIPLNVSALLPNDLSLWRYYGSLTTPSCNEVVVWTVFKKAVPISRSQWEAFKASADTKGKSIVDNYRPPQSTINRKVYFLNNVNRERMPEAGEDDRSPPLADSFYENAQRAVNSKAGSSDDKNNQHGSNSGPGRAEVVNSALTGFIFLSIFLQVLITTVFKCR